MHAKSKNGKTAENYAKSRKNKGNFAASVSERLFKMGVSAAFIYFNYNFMSIKEGGATKVFQFCSNK